MRIRAALDSKHTFWVLWLSGIAIRIIILALLSRFPLRSDPLSYHEMAEKLLLGEKFVPYFPPGLPYYLSIWYATFGNSELVGRAAMIPMYALIAVLLHMLITKLSGRRAANMGLLTISVFPAFIMHSIEPRSILPIGLCLVAAMLLLINQGDCFNKRLRWIRFPLLGLVLGYATLTRPSVLLLAVAVPIYLFAKRKSPWPGMITFVIAAILVSAWLYKAHEMTGRFVMINDANVENFFYGNNPYTPLYKTWWFGSHSDPNDEVPIEYLNMYQEIKHKPPIQRDAEFRRVALEHIASRPDLFLLRTINRICTFFAFDSLTGSSLRESYSVSTALSVMAVAVDAVFYLIIMVLAIVFTVSYKHFALPREAIVMMFSGIILYSLPYWFSFSHPSYHFPILPFIIVFACIVGSRLLEPPPLGLLDNLLRPRHKRYALMIGLFLFLVIQVEWVLFNLSRI